MYNLFITIIIINFITIITLFILSVEYCGHDLITIYLFVYLFNFFFK